MKLLEEAVEHRLRMIIPHINNWPQVSHTLDPSEMYVTFNFYLGNKFMHCSVI